MIHTRSRFIFLGGVILVCVLIAGTVFIYVGYVSSRGVPSRPLVRITETIPAETGVTSQPIVVFAQASDPEGIDRVEFWVNGQQVSAQTNSEQTSLLTFDTSQAWIPSAAGNYLIVLKAIDRAGFLGESEPRIVQVQERSYQSDPQISGEYRLQEGDTLGSVATLFGTTPEDLSVRNPGLGDLSPGSTVLVPPRPEGEATGEAIPPPEGGGEDIPVIDPPPPAPPPSGEREAVPVPDPWWSGLPRPEGSICFFNPAACGRAIGLELPPAAPIYIFWDDLVGSCGFEVNWTDQSENEDGFRIYRITNRPRFRIDLLEIVGPSAGTGAVLFYRDLTAPRRGEFLYAVAAYNAGGESWSGPSTMIDGIPSCAPAEPAVEMQALVVEGLSMSVSGSFDRLYCYASLAGSSFERVPAGALSFITLEAGTWNIAEHFSGSNKREVMASAVDPLAVVVECLGWQGTELINLGRFARSHPPEEWDGRPLTAGPDSGSYSVTYRIQYSFRAVAEEGGAIWPLVDPRVPPPYNLRTVVPRRCDDPATCGRTLLVWDYTPWEGAPRAPLAYKVYRRLPDSSFPALYYTTTGPSQRAPLDPADCNKTFVYGVSAVMGTDPITGEDIQSPLSEELEILPTCASLEITLETLRVNEVYDNDCTFSLSSDCRGEYEAYGWVDFNGQSIRWNDHCDVGLFDLEGCAYVSPSYSILPASSDHNLSNAMLNIGDGWRRGNNVIRIPIEDEEALAFTVTLMDHDATTSDGPWCGGNGRPQLIIPARSAAEWQSLDQVFEADYYGLCSIRFRVRGMP